MPVHKVTTDIPGTIKYYKEKYEKLEMALEANEDVFFDGEHLHVLWYPETPDYAKICYRDLTAFISTVGMTNFTGVINDTPFDIHNALELGVDDSFITSYSSFITSYPKANSDPSNNMCILKTPKIEIRIVYKDNNVELLRRIISNSWAGDVLSILSHDTLVKGLFDEVLKEYVRTSPRKAKRNMFESSDKALTEASRQVPELLLTDLKKLLDTFNIEWHQSTLDLTHFKVCFPENIAYCLHDDKAARKELSKNISPIVRALDEFEKESNAIMTYSFGYDQKGNILGSIDIHGMEGEYNRRVTSPSRKAKKNMFESANKALNESSKQIPELLIIDLKKLLDSLGIRYQQTVDPTSFRLHVPGDFSYCMYDYDASVQEVKKATRFISKALNEFEEESNAVMDWNFALDLEGMMLGHLDIQGMKGEYSRSPLCKAKRNMFESQYRLKESSMNELEKRKKQHSKTNKKGAQGWFTTLGGNPEVSKDFFNRATTFNDGSNIANTASDAGSGEASGGGMGESFKSKRIIFENIDSKEKLDDSAYELADRMARAISAIHGVDNNRFELFLKEFQGYFSNSVKNFINILSAHHYEYHYEGETFIVEDIDIFLYLGLMSTDDDLHKGMVEFIEDCLDDWGEVDYEVYDNINRCYFGPYIREYDNYMNHTAVQTSLRKAKKNMFESTKKSLITEEYKYTIPADNIEFGDIDFDEYFGGLLSMYIDILKLPLKLQKQITKYLGYSDLSIAEHPRESWIKISLDYTDPEQTLDVSTYCYNDEVYDVPFHYGFPLSLWFDVEDLRQQAYKYLDSTTEGTWRDDYKEFNGSPFAGSTPSSVRKAKHNMFESTEFISKQSLRKAAAELAKAMSELLARTYEIDMYDLNSYGGNVTEIIPRFIKSLPEKDKTIYGLLYNGLISMNDELYEHIDDIICSNLVMIITDWTDVPEVMDMAEQISDLNYAYRDKRDDVIKYWKDLKNNNDDEDSSSQKVSRKAKRNMFESLDSNMLDDNMGSYFNEY